MRTNSERFKMGLSRRDGLKLIVQKRIYRDVERQKGDRKTEKEGGRED